MATNKFAARCAKCGTTVAPNAGVVSGDIGARTVTHVECVPAAEERVPAAEPARSFTVRSRALVPDLLVLPDTHRSEQRRRVLGVVAAVGAVLLIGMGVLMFTGEDDKDTTRTTGTVPPTTSIPASSTSVATRVAGVVETRPPTTVAVAAARVTGTGTDAPSTSAAPTTSEAGATAPTAPPETTPPGTAPPTVPPTVAPTTVPTTVVVTTTAPAATTTTVVTTTTKPVTTTTSPVTTTTKRKILGIL